MPQSLQFVCGEAGKGPKSLSHQAMLLPKQGCIDGGLLGMVHLLTYIPETSPSHVVFVGRKETKRHALKLITKKKNQQKYLSMTSFGWEEERAARLSDI